MKNTNSSRKSSVCKQYEDTKKAHKAQKKRFYNYLKRQTVSCTMASKALRIAQKCLTRYKRQLEENGNLWQVKKSKCKITGRWVWYLTTDPDKAPKYLVTQLNLFK